MDTDNEPMKVLAPHGLHYPITITEIVKSDGEDVARSTPLFHYQYESYRPERDRYGEDKQTLQKFYATFDAPVDGIIERWHVRTFDVISKPG